MQPHSAAAVTALVVLLGSCPADSYVNPWPTCDLQYNWYSCRGHPGGAVICDLSVKRDTDEPLAVRSTHHHSYNTSAIPAGLDDFGFLYSGVVFEGIIKLSVRLCSTNGSFISGLIANKLRDPPCRKNWYNCEHQGDRTVCRMKLCPWTNAPLVPKSGEVSDWYECTRNGAQTDCYISNTSADNRYYTEVEDLSAAPVFGPVAQPEYLEAQDLVPTGHLPAYRPRPPTVAMGRRRANYRRAFRKLNAEFFHV